MGTANDKLLDFERASKITFIEACVYYGYMKQYKDEAN